MKEREGREGRGNGEREGGMERGKGEGREGREKGEDERQCTPTCPKEPFPMRESIS